MLTISSITVSPWPQPAPNVPAQPVTTAKPSQNVSPANAGVPVPVAPAGEGAQVQATYVPRALPPVEAKREAAPADVPTNAASPEQPVRALTRQAAPAPRQASQQAADTPEAGPSATTERQSAQPEGPPEVLRPEPASPRFQGELPPEVQNPAVAAMEKQIQELVPNMWLASRQAVDVLIGENARAAAAARAVDLAAVQLPPSASRAPSASEGAVQNYTRQSVEAGSTGKPTPGSMVDAQA
jgi:hypothetical protein